MQPDEVRKYSAEHPCKQCGRTCARVPSATNFIFKGVAEGDPTRKGNSGSHDLDYPSLDKAIGRSANRKWKEYRGRKTERDRLRLESGTSAITTEGGAPAPADAGKMEIRNRAIRTFNRIKGSG